MVSITARAARDRRGETDQGGHRAHLLAGAVHDAGVQLVLAGVVGRRAATGDIEARRFHVGDDLADDVESRGAGLEPIPAAHGQLAHVRALGAIVPAPQGAGAAVQGQCDTPVASSVSSLPPHPAPSDSVRPRRHKGAVKENVG